MLRAVQPTADSRATELLQAHVHALQHLGGDVVQLNLRMAPGQLLQFQAGQHLVLHLADGSRHTLAMANAPARGGVDQVELHLRRTQNSGPDAGPHPGPSASGWAALQVRCEVGIEAPRGHFHWQAGSQRPVVMLAEGTGFAPIKAMVEHALRECLQQPLHLYRGARDREDLYLHELALSWAEASDRINYTPVLSAAADGGAAWAGRSGSLLDALAEDLPDLAAYQVYLCAGPALVDAARRRLLGALRADPEHLHTCELGLA